MQRAGDGFAQREEALAFLIAKSMSLISIQYFQNKFFELLNGYDIRVQRNAAHIDEIYRFVGREKFRVVDFKRCRGLGCFLIDGFRRGGNIAAAALAGMDPAVVFKFLVGADYCPGIDAEVLISFHDEYDGRIIKGVREEMSNLLKDALKEVEVEYELKVELETQTKFGTSWAEVH